MELSPAGTIHSTVRKRAHVFTHILYAPETKTSVPTNWYGFLSHEAILLQTSYCRKSLYPLQACNDAEGIARGDNALIIHSSNKRNHLSLNSIIIPLLHYARQRSNPFYHIDYSYLRVSEAVYFAKCDALCFTATFWLKKT